ncbi:hypothetical protein [Corynebacterium flavescens]|uniref:Uncharacterized protein n=1 Tax=Corynebacterium flavescens TaxID=28028 RepID=A0A1L7CNG9_CORFL|nr:hypothetical protein [Corynebacterium flavescens]APT87397.1 hypothetical protein CFLV_09565 [Corynebacterium flavescens]KAA8720485.1 hypothetical protein F4V60_09305 [Corynebacterium flavescens]GEB97751.1 hypothetical protein CFL01nite_12460 [Corynebacterium flavescens]
MNNHNKAVEVLDLLDHEYNYSEGEWPDNETVVQALADAGLLAPEPPKIINADVLSWHYGQITLKDGGIAVDRSVDEFESEEWFSLEGARQYAIALLAAANYAEEVGQ